MSISSGYRGSSPLCTPKKVNKIERMPGSITSRNREASLAMTQHFLKLLVYHVLFDAVIVNTIKANWAFSVKVTLNIKFHSKRLD